MSFFDGPIRFLTKAANRLTKGGRISAVAPPPLWFNTARVGGELTPEDVSDIMIQADTGRMWRLIDLARECREKDCHLHACLSTLELSLAGMEIQVIPASEKRQDRKIAAFIEEVLNNFGPTEKNVDLLGMADLVQHLAGGYYYGYAVAEIIWEKRDGKVIPVAADPVSPRRFVFNPDNTKLSFWDYTGQLYSYPGVDLTEEFPGRFIQFQPRVLGTGAGREGLMRPLIWASMLRSWAIRDWLALAELAWKPWRIGYYDKDAYATDADVKQLINALEYLTTNGATMLPKTVELDVHWPEAKGGATNSEHKALLDFMAAEISKCVLGQTMTTEDGSSMSQATVHKQVMNERRDAYARSIASTIRLQIVARCVRENFGPDAKIPQIQLVANDVDVAAMADVIQKLCGSKSPMLPISTRQIYKILGFSAPKPGEEILGSNMLAHALTDEEKEAALAKAQAQADAIAAGAAKPKDEEGDKGDEAPTGEGGDERTDHEAKRLRILDSRMRVRLLDDDRAIRAAALAELDARAEAEEDARDRAAKKRRVSR